MTVQRSETVNAGRRLVVESAATGVAYASLLWWASTCLVGSFRYEDLADPYWAMIPGLRTDTSGVIMFFIAAACIYISEYCRVRRHRIAPAESSARDVSALHPAAWASVYAACRAVLLLATGLVCYLSFNVITHPWSQTLQATHLFPWPSESTLRIIALAACSICAAILRFSEGQASSR